MHRKQKWCRILRILCKSPPDITLSDGHTALSISRRRAEKRAPHASRNRSGYMPHFTGRHAQLLPAGLFRRASCPAKLAHYWYQRINLSTGDARRRDDMTTYRKFITHATAIAGRAAGGRIADARACLLRRDRYFSAQDGLRRYY